MTGHRRLAEHTSRRRVSLLGSAYLFFFVVMYVVCEQAGQPRVASRAAKILVMFQIFLVTALIEGTAHVTHSRTIASLPLWLYVPAIVVAVAPTFVFEEIWPWKRYVARFKARPTRERVLHTLVVWGVLLGGVAATILLSPGR